jgi:hypothetical protein
VDFRDSRDEKWSALRIEADQWINVSIPALNLKLWQLGIGAIRPKSLVAEVKDETSTE